MHLNNISSSDNFPVQIDEKALKMAQKAQKELQQSGDNCNFLRISVKGGGCAGLQYMLNFVEEVDEKDLTLQISPTLNLAIDFHSALLLEGTVIEYQETLQESGFKFNNPRAKKHCGCGHSFSSN